MTGCMDFHRDCRFFLENSIRTRYIRRVTGCSLFRLRFPDPSPNREEKVAVITISRGSYSYGKAIAEKVANRLGYDCIAREVLIEASEEFNIPEIKLFSAIHDAPSILDRFISGKEKFIAYIQTALLNYLRKDKVVYHGFGGQFFVESIPHVLKVRINADLEDRVRLSMDRNNFTRKEAMAFIRKLDNQRKKWSKHLYGVNPWDNSLYELVIQLGKISQEDAVEIICHTAKLDRFKTTPESQRAMEDLYLSAKVRAALIGKKPDVRVAVQNGEVFIRATAPEAKAFEVNQNIQSIAEKVEGVRGLKIVIVPVPDYLNHHL
ncbi:MAG: cytidylate kinase-like family protein [Desulfobacteraceae bacterium]|nr:MAG: cytidylate kinase-like family protein [Desulfobacteraceae bacterium]